jgi:hypothetical protein
VRRLLRKFRCRIGRHAWEIRTVETGGVLVAIPRCKHCPRVNVDGIKQAVWNRAERRRWHRAVRRR